MKRKKLSQRIFAGLSAFSFAVMNFSVNISNLNVESAYDEISVSTVQNDVDTNSTEDTGELYLYGDVNGDYSIDLGDVMYLQYAALGEREIPVPFEYADVVPDGVIDSLDVAALQKWLRSSTISLPVSESDENWDNPNVSLESDEVYRTYPGDTIYLKYTFNNDSNSNISALQAKINTNSAYWDWGFLRAVRCGEISAVNNNNMFSLVNPDLFSDNTTLTLAIEIEETCPSGIYILTLEDIVAGNEYGQSVGDFSVTPVEICVGETVVTEPPVTTTTSETTTTTTNNTPSTNVAYEVKLNQDVVYSNLPEADKMIGWEWSKFGIPVSEKVTKVEVNVSTTKDKIGKWQGAFGSSTTKSPDYWTQSEEMEQTISGKSGTITWNVDSATADIIQYKYGGELKLEICGIECDEFTIDSIKVYTDGAGSVTTTTVPETTTTTTETTIVSDVKYGDIDGDGEVSERDAFLLKIASIGLYDIPVPFKFADVVPDGVINCLDSIVLYKHLATPYLVSVPVSENDAFWDYYEWNEPNVSLTNNEEHHVLPGGDLSLDYTFKSDSYGISAFQARINCDFDFEITAVSYEEYDGWYFNNENKTFANAYGGYIFNGADDILHISLKVPENCKPGEYTLTLEDIVAGSEFGQTVGSFTVNPVTIIVDEPEVTEPVTTTTTETTTTTVPDTTESETVTEVTTNSDIIYGDIYEDGHVDIRDVVQLEKVLIGDIYLEDYTNADVNLDGIVNICDAAIMVEYINNNSISLPFTEKDDEWNPPDIWIEGDRVLLSSQNNTLKYGVTMSSYEPVSFDAFSLEIDMTQLADITHFSVEDVYITQPNQSEQPNHNVYWSDYGDTIRIASTAFSSYELGTDEVIISIVLNISDIAVDDYGYIPVSFDSYMCVASNKYGQEIPMVCINGEIEIYDDYETETTTVTTEETTTTTVPDTTESETTTTTAVTNTNPLYDIIWEGEKRTASYGEQNIKIRYYAKEEFPVAKAEFEINIDDPYSSIDIVEVRGSDAYNAPITYDSELNKYKFSGDGTYNYGTPIFTIMLKLNDTFPGTYKLSIDNLKAYDIDGNDITDSIILVDALIEIYDDYHPAVTTTTVPETTTTTKATTTTAPETTTTKVTTTTVPETTTKATTTTVPETTTTKATTTTVPETTTTKSTTTSVPETTTTKSTTTSVPETTTTKATTTTVPETTTTKATTTTVPETTTTTKATTTTVPETTSTTKATTTTVPETTTTTKATTTTVPETTSTTKATTTTVPETTSTTKATTTTVPETTSTTKATTTTVPETTSTTKTTTTTIPETTTTTKATTTTIPETTTTTKATTTTVSETTTTTKATTTTIPETTTTTKATTTTIPETTTTTKATTTTIPETTTTTEATTTTIPETTTTTEPTTTTAPETTSTTKATTTTVPETTTTTEMTTTIPETTTTTEATTTTIPETTTEATTTSVPETTTTEITTTEKTVIKSNGLTYEVDTENKTAVLIDCEDGIENVIIPSDVDGNKVIEIELSDNLENAEIYIESNSDIQEFLDGNEIKYSLVKSEKHILGDIDGDGSITSADALAILQNVVEIRQFTEAEKIVAYVNGDIQITSADALAILQNVVAIREDFNGAVSVSITVSEDNSNVISKEYYDKSGNIAEFTAE